LGDAIRHANGDRKGISLKVGETVTIPGAISSPIVEKSMPVAKDFEVRAIYLTGLMAGSERGRKIMRRWRDVGGNAVVFDIKDSDGLISIPFDHELAGAQKSHPIPELPKFTRYVHSLAFTPSPASPSSATNTWSRRTPNSPYIHAPPDRPGRKTASSSGPILRSQKFRHTT